jgi:hypothetical protein
MYYIVTGPPEYVYPGEERAVYLIQAINTSKARWEALRVARNLDHTWAFESVGHPLAEVEVELAKACELDPRCWGNNTNIS